MEHEAKPRAVVRLRVTGALTGSLEAELPSTVDFPEDPGEALTAEFVPLVAESLVGRDFQALLFAIPGYRGPGSYDLEQMARENGADDWNPLWFQLVLADESEPFSWTPDSGPVDEHEQRFGLTMRMTNAASEEITVEAEIALS